MRVARVGSAALKMKQKSEKKRIFFAADLKLLVTTSSLISL